MNAARILSRSGARRLLPTAAGGGGGGPRIGATTILISRRILRYFSSNNTASILPSSSSVSQEEISKFSSMHKDWWDPKFHPLIAMNPVRIGYILDHLPEKNDDSDSTMTTATAAAHAPPLQGLQALDVGCGGGLLSESLARLGGQVTAIDPSQALVDMAQDHAQQTGDPRLKNIQYRNMTVEELSSDSAQSGKYDIVCLLEVLEHVTSVESLVQAASLLVKKPTATNSGGRLFVSTMNRTIKSHLLTIVGAEYIMGYVPPGTHNWNQYLTPHEVNTIMTTYQMDKIDTSGMVLTRPPLCGNWDWKIEPDDLDVNWIGVYGPKAV